VDLNYITLYVFFSAKPVITSQFGSVVFLLTDSSTDEARCQSHGSPSPIVTWSRLSANGNGTLLLRHKHVAVLNSTILRLYGSGNYVCTASNNVGKTSKFLDVTILSVGKLLNSLLCENVGNDQSRQ